MPAAEDRLIPVVAPLRLVVFDSGSEPSNFGIAILGHVEIDRSLSEPALRLKLVVSTAPDGCNRPLRQCSRLEGLTVKRSARTAFPAAQLPTLRYSTQLDV